MAQNIQVCCRFRPVNEREVQEIGPETVADFQDGKTVILKPTRKDFDLKPLKPFIFDYAFGPESSQEEVFEKTAKPLVPSLLHGYNVTIFAYGQTGSGKTHTMMGVLDTPRRGIIPRLVEEVFMGIEMADIDMEFTLKVSYVEIYMEKIRDLLDPMKDNLRIRELNSDIWLEDVTEIYVGSFEDVLEIMHRGQANRAIGSTRMNEESSRSHSVFIVTLGQSKMGSKKSSKLILVDLAGSEKVGKTGSEGKTLREAKHINRSLSALGNVINALTEGHAHVPYRDSKLTRLLSDSLGGNSKTCLIATASPSEFNFEETVSTLRFGTRVKRIKNKPRINQELSILQYKQLLAQHQEKNERLEKTIEALEREVAMLKAGGSGAAAGGLAALAELEGKGSLVLTLQETVASLEKKNTELREEMNDKDRIIAEMKEEMANKDTLLAQVRKTYAEEQKAKEGIQTDLIRVENKVCHYRDQLAEFEVYKKKVALMEKEYMLKIEQMKQIADGDPSRMWEQKRGDASYASSISSLTFGSPPSSAESTPRAFTPDDSSITPSDPPSSEERSSVSSMPLVHSSSSPSVRVVQGADAFPVLASRPIKPRRARGLKKLTTEVGVGGAKVPSILPQAKQPVKAEEKEIDSDVAEVEKPQSDRVSSKIGPNPTEGISPTSASRERDLVAENKRLFADLQEKCEQHLRLSLAFAELQSVDYEARQNYLFVKEIQDLHQHIQDLHRHNSYQKKLLKNRTQHIAHLEHALHESNREHRLQLFKHQSVVEEMRDKLAKAEEKNVQLNKYLDDPKILERNSKMGASPTRLPHVPRIIVPLRGGTSSAFTSHSMDHKPLQQRNSPPLEPAEFGEEPDQDYVEPLSLTAALPAEVEPEPGPIRPLPSLPGPLLPQKEATPVIPIQQPPGPEDNRVEKVEVNNPEPPRRKSLLKSIFGIGKTPGKTQSSPVKTKGPPSPAKLVIAPADSRNSSNV